MFRSLFSFWRQKTVRRPSKRSRLARLVLERLEGREAPAVLLGWDESSLTGGSGNFGPSPQAATSIAAGIANSIGLTRGTGVSTSGTAAGRAWGGTDWTSGSAPTSVTNDDVLTFGLTVGAGQTASLSSLDLAYRRSGTGPDNGQWAYSINGGGFTDVGAAQSFSSSSSSGATLPSLDLSGVSALQNLAAGTSVTFRLANYRVASGGSSAGTWYVFDTASSSAPDLVLNGALTAGASPTTTTLTDNGLNPSVQGAPVSFTVNITGGATINGATVNIEDASNGNAIVATPTLTNGSATFTVSSLSPGTHNLFAVYAGDAAHQASQSSQVSQVVSASSTIGLNFSGGSGNSFAPPDTDGAIGPSDYVQFINGRFAIYDKTTGAQVLAESDAAFWNAAGISTAITNVGLSDTRVIFDPLSNHWFATEINVATTGNQLLVGRSDTDDPAGTWQAVFFTANSGFGDFPTLAVDAHAVIIGLNNFSDGTASGTFQSVSVTTIPKADLLLSTPTAATRTTVEQTSADIGYTPQGVTNLAGDPGYSSVVALNATTLGEINRTIATGTGAAGATFGATSVLATQATQAPGVSRQPDGTRQLDAGDLRIPGVVYQVGDLIYTAYGISVNAAGVATASGSGTTNAIRVTVLRDSTNTVVAEGTWYSPNFDYSYPSLIANAFGDIIIGFTRSSAVQGSGASDGNAGAYAVQAHIDPNNPTALSFIGSDIQLKAGLVNNYHLLGGSGERWGDFTATSIDPNNPLAFWTTQEYAVSANTWGTQISQIFVSPRETLVTSAAADGTYGTGAVIPITVVLSGAVTVTGTPTLMLNSGATAIYAGGSGTNTLTFNYTVGAGQSSADLDYASTTALSLAGGTIKDSTSALDAILNLATPGQAGSLGANKNIVIASSLTATTTTITANTPNPATVGQTVSFTVTVSPSVPNGESITLQDTSNGNAVIGTGTLSGGSVTIPVTGLAAGTHHVIAVYGGDATYAASQSASVSQIVNAAGGGNVTLRIVDYNIASSGGSPRSGLDTILQAIANEATYDGARPIDILALQEVASQSTTTQAVVNLLNAIYGPGTYARGSVNGASLGAGTQGIVYRTSTVQLIGELAFGSVNSSGIERQPLRYQFHVIGTSSANDFYIYNSHYKASDASSDQNQRLIEAQAIRANADALGQGANIIYVGDYNVYTSAEAMYTTLLAGGNGQAFDPLNRSGAWHNNGSFLNILTQAPASSPPGGLTGGGLDDRFDLQLISGELQDGNGIDYKGGTYHTFGNNGSVPLNGSINAASSTALPGLANRTTVLNLLTTVTDHLPVVADFVVPALLPAVSFTVSSQTGSEAGGVMTITAQLSATSASAVTVPFTLSGTATGGGVDYTISASPITISAGSLSGTITITPTDDTLNEPSETVIVTMGTPTNATLGATTVQTATITDNDPNTAPVITSDGGGVTATLGIAENTTAVTTVVVTDPDVPPQSITYSLSGPDAAKFSITPVGILSFISAPDYETPLDMGGTAGDNIYLVTVTATDNGTPNLSDAQDLSVIVYSTSAWRGYAHDPQHSAESAVASQTVGAIHWETPVDLDPPYSGDDLLIHYGSPSITPANTVLVPVKTGATSGFRVEAHNGADGTLLWTQISDYQLPPHDWVPSYGPTLTATNRYYFAGAGGTVYYINNPDTPGATISGQFAFFGMTNYSANPSAYNTTVFINTPITSDNVGNIYFGFQVTGANPLGLQSGIARIAPDGTGTYISAATAAADAGISKVAHNSAPALSPDGTTLYVAVSNGTGTTLSATGYLVALNSRTLAPITRVRLKDPDGNDAYLPDQGTASPTVGPDGDVYMGVLENPFPYNHDRGWLLHFTANLTPDGAPGAFGWDDTVSIVPASMIPSYTGSSSYLLMAKYNDYAGAGGTGHNAIAVLDPNDTETFPVSGNPTLQAMKEILTILGPTPDDDFPGVPGAVREWCINTAAVDPATHSILVNNEDGKLYRWDLHTNTFTQVITLTSGIGEAYTPTAIGADGTIYAINNATLFAIGNNTPPTITSNGGGATASVSVAENTTSVATVSATDPDVGPLTYSVVGGADQLKFQMVGNALSFVTAPDFESPTDVGGNNVYDVIVQVSDGNGGVDTQAIAVTVTDVAEGSTLDFGDAPDTYGTLLASNGARHTATGPMLGTLRDTEADGQPSVNADGDGTDEDGVAFNTLYLRQTTSVIGAVITVSNAPSGAELDAWIDFNGNGVFDAAEEIANDVSVVNGANNLSFAIPSTATLSATFARFRLSSAGGLGATGAAADGEVEDYKVTIQQTPVSGAPKINGDYAPISGASQSGSTVTFTTNGSHGFTAGNTVVIAGYAGGNAGYNGTFTIVGTPTANTFTVTNATAGLPTLTFNTQGFAVSKNTASALQGTQRSMVDSVVYSFAVPVDLTTADFALSTFAPTTSGPATAATAVPNMVLTSLDGGSIWVMTWSSATGNTIAGHSIADGVYDLALTNSNRSSDRFYRLFGDTTPATGASRVNAADNGQFSLSWLKNTGDAGYNAAFDSNGDGRVNAADNGQFSLRWLSTWSGFTATI